MRGDFKRGLALLIAIALGALVMVWWSLQPAPLPAPAPFDGPLPTASPPADMRVYQLPTGVTHRTAGAAYRGGSFSDRRDFAMAAVLVKHPRGDLLIDTGFGREIATHFGEMPWLFRALTPYEQGTPAVDQLHAAGYDPERLRAILLTHAHWDHVSGIPDFPGVPVLVTAAERRFVADGGMIAAVARGLPDVRWEEYAFPGGPYLGFPQSHDVYGDGAIVVVPAPGHTPGSVIVFLTEPSGRRWALLGDLVWQREGITLREERPWFLRIAADGDAAGVRESILRMAAIAARFPEIVLVPAHDARGFAEMPRLDAGPAAGLVRLHGFQRGSRERLQVADGAAAPGAAHPSHAHAATRSTVVVLFSGFAPSSTSGSVSSATGSREPSRRTRRLKPRA